MKRLLWLICLLGGCSEKELRPAEVTASSSAHVQSEAIPSAPLQLARPTVPPKRLGQIKDLSALDGPQLTALMEELYQQADYPGAAAAGQWAILRGGDGRYNLACCLALSGQLDQAYYFLQEAAALEGVDSALAAADPDLAELRKQSRWSQVANYLEELQRHWARQTVLNTSLVLPEHYHPGQPIRVVIGLHGLGGSQAFVHDGYQSLADELEIALIGVNGSIPLGPKAFRWSEDPSRDEAQLQKALESLRPRLTVAPGKILLFGFSQGAQMAFEIAAARPSLYQGALCFSPGRLQDNPWSHATTPNRAQRYLFAAGAAEDAETLRRVRENADWARQVGAQVRVKLYPGIATHGFPPDFATQFGPWLQWALEPS